MLSYLYYWIAVILLGGALGYQLTIGLLQWIGFDADGIIAFILALIGWAVIPFDEGVVLADINVGIMYLFAISGLGVYGIAMAGWAGTLRPSAGSLPKVDLIGR